MVKNLEIAKINLQKETPLYQIIDFPEMPLKQERPSRLFYAILGAVLLFFLTAGFVVISTKLSLIE